MKRRRKRAGVPESVAFATKHEIAWTQIEAALAAGIARGTVLMDAGYENAILRDRLTEHQLQYAAGIHPQTMLWWGEHQPGPMPPKPKRGPQRKRAVRDAAHQPISALHIARALPADVLLHRELARRHERVAQFAFCPRTGACGTW